MHKMQFCFRVILATVLVTFAAFVCCAQCPSELWVTTVTASSSPGHQGQCPLQLLRRMLGLFWCLPIQKAAVALGRVSYIYIGKKMWVGFHSSVLQYHVVYAYGLRKAGVKSGFLPLSNSSPPDFGTLSNVLYCFLFLLVLQQCV